MIILFVYLLILFCFFCFLTCIWGKKSYFVLVCFLIIFFFLFLFFKYMIYFSLAGDYNLTGELIPGRLYSSLDEPSSIRYYFDRICCVVGGKGWGYPVLTNDEIVYVSRLQARLIQDGLPALSHDDIAERIYASRGRDRLFLITGAVVCIGLVWAKDGPAGVFRMFPFYIPRSKSSDVTDDNFQPFFRPAPEDYLTLD